MISFDGKENRVPTGEEMLFRNIGKGVEIETFEGREIRGCLTEIVCNTLFIQSTTGVGGTVMCRFEDIRFLKTF